MRGAPNCTSTCTLAAGWSSARRACATASSATTSPLALRALVYGDRDFITAQKRLLERPANRALPRPAG